MTESREPWWVKAFGPSYRLVYPHRSDAKAAGEVASACSWLEIHAGMRVLDAACGDGRHLVSLIDRGVDACGVDLSAAMCAAARARGSLPVVRADQRRLPFADAMFERVVSFFSSFGYFDDPREDVAVLAELARVLVPKGRFLLDLADGDWVRSHIVPSSREERGEVVVISQRAFDGPRVRKHVRIESPAGVLIEQYSESLRLFTEAELDAMLRDAGFRVLERHGDFAGVHHGKGDRMITVAEKIG